MSEPRAVFLGNDPWSAVALDAMVVAPDPIVPVAVVTRVPRPARRGSGVQPTEVAVAARRLNLPLAEVDTVRSGGGLEALRSTRPDVLVVVAYGELLPPEVLDLPPRGCVNVHLSLLPRWRGAAPVQYAIRAGDEITGVTIIQMDTGLDTGAIVSRIEVTVGPSEDAGSLGARLAGLGGELLARTLPAMDAGRLRPTPQPVDGVTHAPKLTAADREVRWTERAIEIDRMVRSVSPAPGANARFRSDVVRIVRGEPAPGDGAPGVILGTDAVTGGVDVGTAEGVYRLLDVAPAGKRHMHADGWARGARFAEGERFDAPASEDA